MRDKRRPSARRLAALVATALGLTLAGVLPAEAAGPTNGYDISWPQCSGQPMPPSTSQFVIIGLNGGKGFSKNPCLASQVAWARDHGQWTAAYAIATYPTDAQLAQYGGTGPLAQQLYNVGVAEANDNLANLRGAKVRTSLVWIDVEPVSSAPWSADSTKNNPVIDGLIAGYQASGYKVGFYSYQSAWTSITFDRQSSSIPTWVPAGKSSASDAGAKCSTSSFSGGPVLFGQWTDGTYDYDVACPGKDSGLVLAPPDASHDPIGSFDGVQLAPGGLQARGWAIDPDTTSPIAVHLYVGSTATPVTAGQSRPDVGAAYPSAGSDHGFAGDVATPLGSVKVCAYAINDGAGYANTTLGCRTGTVTANPIGSFDTVRRAPGGLHVRGWAIDPDTASPITVHGYVGGAATAVTAGATRSDVGAAFPAFGAAHGVDAVLPAPGTGNQQVCLYGINSARGSGNPTLGCRTVAVSHVPYGSLDTASVTGTLLHVTGWGIDPDSSSPVTVTVTADGAVLGTFVSSGSRPDVGAAYPDYGSAHGYDFSRPVLSTPHTVCVSATPVSGGASTTLQCRTLS